MFPYLLTLINNSSLLWMLLVSTMKNTSYAWPYIWIIKSWFQQQSGLSCCGPAKRNPSKGVIPSLLQKLFPSQNIPDVTHTTLCKMLLTVFVKRTLYNQQHVLWPDQLCTRPRVGTMFKALSIKVFTKASSLSFSNLHPTKLLNKKKICRKYLYYEAQHKKNQP